MSGDVIGDLDLVDKVMEGLGDDAVGDFDLGVDVNIILGGDVMDDLGDGICNDTAANITGDERSHDVMNELGDNLGDDTVANFTGDELGGDVIDELGDDLGDDTVANVTGDELGDSGSGSDANVSSVQLGDGSSGVCDVDGDDMEDDVIFISDEEDCTDITEFQSYEKTQIVTLTIKRKVRLVNGVDGIENFRCVVHHEEFIN